MERLSSFTILDSSQDIFRIASNRVGIRFGQIYGWFKDKSRQIRALAVDDDLIQAVFSAEKPPIEGARYRVGECINVYRADGECRRFKICGVQSGGFSNVYTVIDLDEMRPYCLKENRAIPGDEVKKNEKLAVEADISLRLGLHPNLVTTYSAFYFKSRLFILTEYLPATSLDLHLKAGPLLLETTLRYAVYLCRAVHFAQATLPGFVHGDIKPGNCFVTADGTLKLGDFGLASAAGLGKHQPNGTRAAEDWAADTNTSVGWGGTSAYMAPEMFDTVAPDRKSADIYAFGVTLFEMLGGTCPFISASKSDLADMHRHKSPPFEILIEKNVPSPIVELIRQCLAKVPGQRPVSNP
jgi:serine/threonine protein kinase